LRLKGRFNMPAKTQKEMLGEVYQAMIGLPENPEENGMIGDVREIKDILVTQNGRIRSNEKSISRIKGILVGISALGGIAGAGFGISQLVM